VVPVAGHTPPMSVRTRAALIAALVGLLLAVLVAALTGTLSDREAAVVGEQDGLSLSDEERISDGRIQLSNYCTAAIKASRGEVSTPAPQATEVAARRIVGDLLRLAREHPGAYINEIGSMRTVLTGAAGDLETPACLPDEARRLRVAAARLPESVRALD